MGHVKRIVKTGLTTPIIINNATKYPVAAFVFAKIWATPAAYPVYNNTGIRTYSARPAPATMGEHETMALTEAQIQQFKTEGYLVIPDFWDARETAAIQAEIERLKRDGPALQYCDRRRRQDRIADEGQSPALSHAREERFRSRDALCAEGDRRGQQADRGSHDGCSSIRSFLKPGKHGAGTTGIRTTPISRSPIR